MGNGKALKRSRTSNSAEYRLCHACGWPRFENNIPWSSKQANHNSSAQREAGENHKYHKMWPQTIKTSSYRRVLICLFNFPYHTDWVKVK